jgi:GMP reductase
MAVTSGIRDSDNVRKILTAVPNINYINLDVANGYMEVFVQHVKYIRASYPDKTIIVKTELLNCNR